MDRMQSILCIGKRLRIPNQFLNLNIYFTSIAQTPVCVFSFSMQGTPLSLPSFKISLVLVLIPPPQLFEQSVHIDHGEYSQFTELHENEDFILNLVGENNFWSRDFVIRRRGLTEQLDKDCIQKPWSNSKKSKRTKCVPFRRDYESIAILTPIVGNTEFSARGFRCKS